MPESLEEPTRLINLIGTAIVHDPAYVALDWESIALVAGIEPGGSSVRLHGYAYLTDGSIVPELPEAFEIHDMFRDLHDAMAQVSPKPWRVALVQVRRATGHIRFHFETDDPSRWAVTPTNWRSMQEELRPADDQA